jgi:hypothetical protein
MKTNWKIFGLLLCCLLPGLMIAQQAEQQTGDTTRYQTLIPRQNRIVEEMNMIANMQFAYRSEFQDGEYVQSRFKMNNLDWRSVAR